MLIALALCAVASLLRFNSIPVGTFFDDAHYLILAESLANGDGYRLINFPAAPVEQAFPPGWPLLLAPLAAVAPGNLLLPRLLALAFSLGSIVLADLLFRPRLDQLQRWLFLGLFALNPFFVGSAGTVMSEPAYLFFSLLVLVLLDYYVAQSARWQLAIVIVAVAFFATLVRTLGISILATAVIGLIPKKHWKPVALALSGLVLLGVLMLIFAPNGFGTVYLLSPTYQGHVEFLSGEILNYLQVWKFLPQFDYPLIGATIVPVFDLSLSFIPFFEQVRGIGAVLMLLCVIVGYGLRLKEWQLSELYVLFFAAIFYMWTAYISEIQQRQLVPMIPFFSFYLVTFLNWAIGRMWPTSPAGERPKIGRTALIGVTVLILITYAARHANEIGNPVRDLVVDYSIAGDWLQTNTAEDAIVSVNYPEPTYLYARRQTDYLPGNFAADEIDLFLSNRNIDYVVIQPGLTDWSTGELKIEGEYVNFLVPHLDQNSGRYEKVFEDEENQVSIYRVLK